MLHVKLDQVLYLLCLLKRRFHLSEEYAFDRSQFFLNLILLLACVKRVESLKVLQEHIAYVLKSLSLIFRECLSVYFSLCTLACQLFVQMPNHGRFTLSRRLELEIVIVTLFRHQIFQILIDFTLDLPLLIV